jgi:glycosyltransferase involved in cell wall biosynthesis
MKLIIQIPALNEEQTLPVTLKDLPQKIEGIDEIETLIISDGSTDRTVEVAKQLGVNHIVKFNQTRGLARAFSAGLDACLRLGADIIVNTDADNQYQGRDIIKLVRPILEDKASMVVGCRDIDHIEHFSENKKRLQKLGSWVVRQLSNTDVPDTTSGFRAYSREAALKLNVVSDFTYTLETIIQAGNKDISINHVAIGTNEKLRESRLFTSLTDYLKRSVPSIIRIYAMYQPLRVFFYAGLSVMGLGCLISLRFVISYIINPSVSRHIQSLILAAVLFIIGFQIVVIGLVSDIIAANRKLIEDVLYRIKRLELPFSREEKRHSAANKNSQGSKQH